MLWGCGPLGWRLQAAHQLLRGKAQAVGGAGMGPTSRGRFPGFQADVFRSVGGARAAPCTVDLLRVGYPLGGKPCGISLVPKLASRRVSNCSRTHMLRWSAPHSSELGMRICRAQPQA